MIVLKQSIIAILTLLLFTNTQTPTTKSYRTADGKYSVKIAEVKQSNKIFLSIKLYQGQLFEPWLLEGWDQYSKQKYYRGQLSNFKFFLYPKRNSKDEITQFGLMVFYYGNGYDKSYTEFLFNDDYFREK